MTSTDGVDVADWHRRAVVVDTHNDLLMLVDRRVPQRQASYFRERWLPQLRQGGVDVQVLPIYVDEDFRPEAALRQTFKMIETAWRVAAANSDAVTLCLDGADVDAALAANRMALVLALEGCDAIGGDVDLLATLARAGIRIASLTHFGRNQLADGSGEDQAGSRLTRSGIEAVHVAEEVGILIDVSHLGARCVDHVLELATRPVIATHSCAWALCHHHRNLTDERIRGIAATGGVVHVNFAAGYLDSDPSRRTLDRLVDHMEHVASVGGMESVGIGPDFVRELLDEMYPHEQEFWLEGIDGKAFLPGLDGPSGLPLVTEALVSRGWTEDEIRAALGGNAMRLFRTTLGVTATRAAAAVL